MKMQLSVYDLAIIKCNSSYSLGSYDSTLLECPREKNMPNTVIFKFENKRKTISNTRLNKVLFKGIQSRYF